MSGLTRRKFLRYSAALGAAAAWPARRVLGEGASQRIFPQPDIDLAVITGDDPASNCNAAIEALGGFARFVRPGDRVAVKPNPIGNSPPEAALNTHPDMVAAVVRGCLAAGAARVVVLSHDERRSMELNGTAAAVAGAGGELVALSREDEFREIVVPRGTLLRRTSVAADIVAADVFINMPIAKHHAETEVTLSLKNLMGAVWDRIRLHMTDLHRGIAELGTAIPHTLVVMDANHVLLNNGPAGPGEVRRARQVVAGVDPLAVDAFIARAFFRDAQRIPHLLAAYELGVGEIDLAKLRVREITL